MSAESCDAHCRGLEGVFRSSPVNARLSAELRVAEGTATLILDVNAELHHAAGTLHGAHVFKVLDDAAFFAASSMETDFFLATTTFTVHLLRPIASGRLTAEGHVVRTGRTLLWAESRALDEQGRVVAFGSGSFVRTGVTLTSLSGYADTAARGRPVGN
jgi:uncharacterized protein (TIGR00369 family)